MRSLFRRSVNDFREIAESNRAIREGVANQSALLNDKLGELIAGLNNLQMILSDKLSLVIDASGNEQRLLNDKLELIIQGLAIEQGLINDKLTEQIENQRSYFIEEADRLNKIIGIINNDKITQSVASHLQIIEAKLDRLIAERAPAESGDGFPAYGKSTTEEALRRIPLLLAPKTYNTDHPDYDPALARNFPGVLQNGDRSSGNPALRAIRQVMQASETNGRAWADQLEIAFAELKTIPGAEQLFQRKAKAEHFFLDANNRFEAHYWPGWVNLDDGLFLYWLIRRLRPRVVVETGVCNGFSSGLILLALAKNGNEGKLHAVGRAEIFDPDEPHWTSKGKVFGEVIIQGHGLGWMVPDHYRNAVEFQVGEAEALLPEIVEKVDAIDLFFHDSDHSYDHMTFEFEAVRRKLSPQGVVAADNIAWNSSLWDFADNHGVPAYNFQGAIGAAFFG